MSYEEMTQEQIDRALLEAAKNGDEAAVRELLEANANVNQADNGGRTPLYFAAWRGHTQVVEELLLAGANVNLADNNGYTPLYRSVQEGHAGVVDVLTKHAANTNMSPHRGGGDKPLRVAGYSGHTEIVKTLLRCGALFTSEDNELLSQEKPLCQAAIMGDLEQINSLISEGHNVTEPGTFGLTPLRYAITHRQFDAAKELIARGADINTPDDHGKTALDYEIIAGDINVCGVLMNNLGAKPTMETMYVALQSGRPEMTKVLFVNVDIDKAIAPPTGHNTNTQGANKRAANQVLESKL
jgi:ankyrin repeat protein